MDIKTAIETAEKMRKCSFTWGYYCSLKGCDDCGNYVDAKEELEMLETFIELGEKQNRNTINLTVEVDDEKIKSYLAEADIVEVVRCADCLYRTGVICTKSNRVIMVDGYCDDGRKK